MRPKELEDLPKHLSFVPQGNASGIQVRISHRGEMHQKFYALSHFESPEDCLFAARLWRDIQLSELDRDPEEAHEARSEHIFESTTRTGIRGFGFEVTINEYNGRVGAHAQWQEDGKPVQRRRSLRKHGIDGASAQLARIMVDGHPLYLGEDPEALAGRCATALRVLITDILDKGRYPPSRRGKEEERFEVLKRFAEKEDTIPLEESPSVDFSPTKQENQ